MKTYQPYLTIALISFLALYGCQQDMQEITEQEKEKIISEISRFWEISGEGIEQHDAEDIQHL